MSARLRDAGGRVFPFEYSTNVSADTSTDNPVVTSRTMPFTGRVRTIVVGWPDGTQNQVGVQFAEKSGEVFFPRNPEDEYIAANDFTHPFEMNVPFQKGDSLVSKFVNLDTTNDHFVNVIAILEEVVE